MDSTLKFAVGTPQASSTGDFQDVGATVTLDPVKLAQAQGLATLAFSTPLPTLTTVALPMLAGSGNEDLSRITAAALDDKQPSTVPRPPFVPTGVALSADEILKASVEATRDGVDRRTPFVYTVRIHPNPTRSYKLLTGMRGTYIELSALRRDFVQCLHEDGMLPDSVKSDDARLTVGYIKPGHGARGQKIYLVNNNSLSDMYQVCRVRKKVMLWYAVTYDVNIPDGMYAPGTKRAPRTPKSRKRPPSGEQSVGTNSALPSTPSTVTTGLAVSNSSSPAVSNTNGTMMLGTSTPGASTALQSNWSFDVLNQQTPSAPSSTAPLTSASQLLTMSTPTATSGVDTKSSILSPRAQARTMLIDQLRSWFDLYQAGAVPRTDFELQRARILNDMSSL